MKKAILISVLAVLFCVFCACQGKTDSPAGESTDTTVLTASGTEPERTRVPVSTSTLPPLPDETEAPGTEPEIDTSLFQPETFEEGAGVLEVVTDVPGHGAIGN